MKTNIVAIDVIPCAAVVKLPLIRDDFRKECYVIIINEGTALTLVVQFLLDSQVVHLSAAEILAFER